MESIINLYEKNKIILEGLNQGRTKKPKHPGEVIRSLLDMADISQKEFARLLCVSRITVNNIINKRFGISPEMSFRLEAVTKIEARRWLQYQNDFDLWELSNSENLEDELNYIMSIEMYHKQIE